MSPKWGEQDSQEKKVRAGAVGWPHEGQSEVGSRRWGALTYVGATWNWGSQVNQSTCGLHVATGALSSLVAGRLTGACWGVAGGCGGRSRLKSDHKELRAQSRGTERGGALPEGGD